MPKSKKPAGGRPAKNFEPRYGEKKTLVPGPQAPHGVAAAKAGSRSPGHRGYRAAEEGRPRPGRQDALDREAARRPRRGPRHPHALAERPSRAFVR